MVSQEFKIQGIDSPDVNFAYNGLYFRNVREPCFF